MDCRKADIFIMKYMDGNIKEHELEILNEHIIECEACRADFMLYNEMLNEFSDINNIIEAPDDIEVNVMNEISMLNVSYNKYEIKNENFLYLLWGILSLFTASGIVYAVNKTDIELFFNKIFPNISIQGIVDFFGNFVYSLKIDINMIVDSLLSTSIDYVISLRYVSLLLFVLLLFTLVIINHKDIKKSSF